MKPAAQNTTKQAKRKRPAIRESSITHCQECKKELVKKEAAICDECRLRKLGWVTNKSN